MLCQLPLLPKRVFIEVSLHLKTVFRLNFLTLQAFLYVRDYILEIITDSKFDVLLEA
jgi:hypothetical protein